MNELAMRDINSVFVSDDTLKCIQAPLGSLSQYIFQAKKNELANTSKNLTNKIISSSPGLTEAVKSLGKEEKLRLVFSDEVKQKIADGTYHLMTVKDESNAFRAIAVDAKGKTREIGKVAFDEVTKNADPTSMAVAMQGMAIQQQLQEISEQLEQICSEIKDVLMGQHNDRLALYYAGEMLIKESLAVNNEQLRGQLECSAMHSLSEGCSSLQVSLMYDIKSLFDKYDEAHRKLKMTSREIEDKIFVIKSSFETIHKCVYLKAAVYYSHGEYSALAVLLNSYKAFLEETLDSKTENLLYNHDKSEKKLSGIWKTRAVIFPQQIEALSAKISSHEAYLEIDQGGLKNEN